MIRFVGVSAAACLAAASVVIGPLGPAFATTNGCRDNGARLVELYSNDLGGNWAGIPHVVIDSGTSPAGDSLLCVYVRDSYLSLGSLHSNEVGGVVTLRGYQAPPGVLPTVTTDLSGCESLLTLANGELGDPNGPAHAPYRIAAGTAPSPTVCVVVGPVAFRVSYGVGGIGSVPDVGFEPDVSAVRSDPPVYPAEDSLRPSTACFYGGNSYGVYRSWTYLMTPSARIYYASEEEYGFSQYATSKFTRCYRADGMSGVFAGAAETKDIYRSDYRLPTTKLDESSSSCTTNVASAESPVSYSVRYGSYQDPWDGLAHNVLCVSVAGTTQTIGIVSEPGVQDIVALAEGALPGTFTLDSH